MLAEIKPTVPASLSRHARKLLDLLREREEAGAFVLGGGVALSHYCDYRTTYDLDAWWADKPDEAAWTCARSAFQVVAGEEGGTVHERQWGTTSSLELHIGTQKTFSFQVSVRDVTLDAAGASAWPPVLLETFKDNLGSKMNALVGRGSPRDFRDIAELCFQNLAAPEDCWTLWQLKNSGRDREEARLQVLRNLEVIEARRSLQNLPPAERVPAARLRTFIREVFCARPKL